MKLFMENVENIVIKIYAACDILMDFWKVWWREVVGQNLSMKLGKSQFFYDLPNSSIRTTEVIKLNNSFWNYIQCKKENE